MNPRSFAIGGVLLSIVLAPGSALSAQRSTIPPASTKSGATRDARTALLPDPALLDGSSQPPEKRSEFGMIGDFELPGDETRSERVGGQQGQPGGGAADPAKPAGGGTPPPPGGSPPANAAGAGAPPPGQIEAAGAAQQQGPAGGGAEPVGATGQPQGAQVGQLSGPGGGPQQGGDAGRPPPVTIGDKSMQIPLPNAALAGVSATQPPGTTQHHEKPTGTGGKPPEGDNTNKGAERGRVMPTGL